jgi:hypothetical protein
MEEPEVVAARPVLHMTDDSLAPIGDMLFENEHVRVWENVVEPGEESPVHRHTHNARSARVTPPQCGSSGA